MYTVLSKFYDNLMYDCDYYKWSQYFYSCILEGRSGKIQGLELGSGSGEMTIRLKKLGLDICGLDISEEMLAIAYQKALAQKVKVMFLEGSCVDFEYRKNLDFIIAPIDCFSYITCEQLKKTIQNAHAHLKSGGVFMFDIRSQHELECVHANNLFFEDAGDICWFWENKLESDRVDMNITIFEKIENLFKKHIEKQTFYIHKTTDVVDFLEQSGFENIQLFADPDKNEFKEESQKLCVLCTKA